MKFNGYTSFVIGVSAGAVVALLIAPRSGKATRRYVGRRIGDGKEAVEHAIERVREIGEDIQDKGKETIRSANRVLNSVAKAGMSAAALF